MTVPKDAKKKKVVQGDDFDFIFARAMCRYSADEIKINDQFLYEVAPTQTALFKCRREGRYSTLKADLKNVLKVEVSVRNNVPEATLIDGCAMIHRILHWPKSSKVRDLLVGLDQLRQSHKLSLSSPLPGI